jgi:hypothetical protein
MTPSSEPGRHAAAARALAAGGGAVTDQGHGRNGAVQTWTAQGADAWARGGSVPRTGVGATGQAGVSLRGSETRDRKANRVPADPGGLMVTVGLDELGDDDDDMQGHSQQQMAHLREDIAI